MKEYDNKVPIYMQIIMEMKIRMVSGKLSAGEKNCFCKRELAQEFEVNPNTMQKSIIRNGKRKFTLYRKDIRSFCNN